MSAVQERYRPLVVGVDTSVKITGNSVGGFLAKTAGTITVVDHGGVTIVNAVAVAAGNYVPLPFFLGEPTGAATVTTAGGASGTLGVN